MQVSLSSNSTNDMLRIIPDMPGLNTNGCSVHVQQLREASESSTMSPINDSSIAVRSQNDKAR